MRPGTVFLKILFLLIISTPAWAQDFDNLSAEGLRNRINQRVKMLIVDARPRKEYGKGHLPTAINIPPQQFSSIANHLPPEKDLPIVFYCGGYT